MVSESATIEPTATSTNLRLDANGESFMIPGLPADSSDIETQAPLIRNAWYVIAARSDAPKRERLG
jgi:hypothetical protein